MEYVQRAGRFSINILHHVRLVISDSSQSKDLEVSLKNISPSGLAMVINNSSISIKINNKIDAKIYFSQKVLNISLIPRHIHNEIVGCQIDKGLKEYSAQFEEYFLEESLASEMFPIKNDETHFWYSTEQNRSTLQYEIHHGKIINFTLTILGNAIQVDKNGTATFSFLVNTNSKEQEKVFVKIHEFPDEIVVLCLRFMQSVEIVPENIKLEICEMVKRHSVKRAA
jgi:hypothetical protein